MQLREQVGGLAPRQVEVVETTVHKLDAKDTSLSEIHGAERFCHLLTAIGFDAAGHRWFEGRVEEMEAFYTRQERAQVLLQESFVENFADLPAAEAGASDTPPRRALLSYARNQPDDAEWG